MGDGGGDGRIFPEHPSPILHAPRDIISRTGKSLTPITITPLPVLGTGRKKLSVLGTSGDHLGPLGPSRDHLGNGFDEVIGFITESDLPECADRSVRSSEAPTHESYYFFLLGKITYQKNEKKKNKNGQKLV